MERTSFNYSTKNIPVASEKDYTKRLIEKTEEFPLFKSANTCRQENFRIQVKELPTNGRTDENFWRRYD